MNSHWDVYFHFTTNYQISYSHNSVFHLKTRQIFEVRIDMTWVIPVDKPLKKTRRWPCSLVVDIFRYDTCIDFQNHE